MHERTIEIVNIHDIGCENTVFVTLRVRDEIDDEEHIYVWVSEHFNGDYDWDFNEGIN